MMKAKMIIFQSTRLSRASTCNAGCGYTTNIISIHKALASLDLGYLAGTGQLQHFNPQGSREPRQARRHQLQFCVTFQSTRLSRASTTKDELLAVLKDISIHKALASLDGKNAQLFLHLCHIYMLHIIHLLQLVYQVEISSRNLIVFSGQL